jgi:hypothetical protein
MVMDRFEAVEEAAFAVFGAPISSYERNIVSRVYDEVEPVIRRAVEEHLLDFVEGSVVQGCFGDDGLLDSMAISTWADGIRLLAEHGRAEIIEEHGRRVIARLIPGAP